MSWLVETEEKKSTRRKKADDSEDQQQRIDSQSALGGERLQRILDRSDQVPRKRFFWIACKETSEAFGHPGMFSIPCLAHG
jgi:hypothetical protein